MKYSEIYLSLRAELVAGLVHDDITTFPTGKFNLSGRPGPHEEKFIPPTKYADSLHSRAGTVEGRMQGAVTEE